MSLLNTFLFVIKSLFILLRYVKIILERKKVIIMQFDCVDKIKIYLHSLQIGDSCISIFDNSYQLIVPVVRENFTSVKGHQILICAVN